MAPRTKAPAKQTSVKTVKKETKKRGRPAKAGKEVPQEEVQQAPEAVAEPMEEPTEEPRQEEDNCAICVEGISLKGQISFTPCNHVLHRKCGMEYLEKLNSPLDQKCPLCRVPVETIINFDKNYEISISNVMCYGDLGKPTKRMVLEHAKWHKMPEEDIGQLLWLLISRSVHVQNDLKDDNEGTQLNYKQRMQDQKEHRLKCETVEARVLILRQMEQLWRAGGMNYGELTMKNIDHKFNFKAEMDRCKRLKGAKALSEIRRLSII